MLPLSLLNASQGEAIMVELKSGESLNGVLQACDSFMNVTLTDVVRTSPDGKSFSKSPEIFVRGTLVKYVRVPDEMLERIIEERHVKREERRLEERRDQDRRDQESRRRR